MKKALSMLLAILMVLSLLPMTVLAASNPTIYFETNFTTALAAGDTFTVTAHLKDNVRFDALTLTLKWNDKAVKFNGFATNNRGIPTSEVFNAGEGYTTASVNQETGKIVGVDFTGFGYDNNGMLFIANFEIVGEGALDISLRTEDPTVFEMVDNNGVDQAPILDTSALDGLTVGGKPVGPEMPEDAPFTAITTDAGPIVAIEEAEWVNDVPYYIVTIPADAETAYVTAPDQVVMEDYMTGKPQATAYASDQSFSSEPLYISYDYEDTADGPKVEIPMNMEGSDFSGADVELDFINTHAFGIEDASYACLGWISFVYDDGAESYDIHIDDSIVGGSVWAENSDGGEITKAKEGAEVWLGYEANSGYQMKTIGYICEGHSYHAENGVIIMPAGEITLTATFEKLHTHVYDKEVVADKYLKDAATCKSGAVYYKSCACGEFVTTAETFVSGETVDHDYVDGACKWCGEAATEPILSFTASGQTLEAVTAEGNCSDYGMTAQKLTVTVPAGVNTVTINCAASMCAYIDHGPNDLAPTGKSAEIDLNQDLTFVCVYVTLDDGNDACYHVYFEQEAGDVDPEPEVPAATGIKLNNSALVENAAGSATNYTLNMAKGSFQTLTVTLEPAGAQDTVNWASSDESVATVENGVITAQGKGTATIIAYIGELPSTAADESTTIVASLTVNVGEGYTVTLPADKVLNVGETVSIPVVVGHSDKAVTTFNSFDMTFTYDAALLKLTSTKIEGMTVTDNNGTVRVQRYGTDMTVGSTAFTLTFEAIANGTTNVTAVDGKALVGVTETALDKDADKATILDTVTEIVIGGYTVILPDDFTGDSAVEPGEDYTFEAKDKNYDYEVKAIIDGTEVPVEETSDGSFKIAADNITGNIVITSTKTGKTFDVTLGEDMTGEATAQYMTEYTATLNKADGYNYQIEVTIGGKSYTGFNYDPATGEVTIPGADITGAIVFNSNKTEKTADKHSVEIGGDGAGNVEAEQEATDGQDFTFTVNKLVGYTYTVTATMNGETVDVIDNGDGTYTIEKVSGDLVITVTKTYDMEVEVSNYVTLDGKTMFLVTAKASVDTGKALAYNGETMYYSEVYGAWSYLVITEGTLSVDDAKALITLVEATATTLTQTYDVNESGRVDINDAQLVFDMYNNEYQDFDKATMQKFLKADVNGDGLIDSKDAAAVVSNIVAQ